MDSRRRRSSTGPSLCRARANTSACSLVTNVALPTVKEARALLQGVLSVKAKKGTGKALVQVRITINASRSDQGVPEVMLWGRHHRPDGPAATVICPLTKSNLANRCGRDGAGTNVALGRQGEPQAGLLVGWAELPRSPRPPSLIG